MRIAIVGPFFFPYEAGIEKVMWNHAEQLARLGHDVRVFTSHLRFPNGVLRNTASYEEVAGFSIVRLAVPVRSPSRLFYYLSNGGLVIAGLSAALKRFSPDIVHCHNIAAPSWAWLSAQFCGRNGARFFYSPHYHPNAIGYRAVHTSLMHLLNRRPLRRAVKILHLTRADLAPFAVEYPGVKASKQVALRNGVRATPYVHRHAPSTRRKLLFVGRVDEPRKGFDLLIEAFRRLPSENYHLDVVGAIEADRRNRLILEFGDRITVHGVVSEVALRDAYEHADLFVMPSEYEAFGMPFIEAMQQGLPVIGRDVGGVSEVVPADAGLLLRSADAEELSTAIVDILADPMRYLRLSTAGRSWSEHFTWQKVVQDLVGLYEDSKPAL